MNLLLSRLLERTKNAAPALCRIAGTLSLSLAVPQLLHAALPAADADNGGIKLPPGFQAVVVADNLGSLRFLTVAPNGDVFVKVRDGGIIALHDGDGDGRAETRQTFGSGGGSGIALRDGWLYHSSNSAVYRYRVAPGELVPKGPQETVVSGLPDGGQHNSKSFAFDETGRLLVEVGSPSNSYGDPDRAKGAKGKDPTEFLATHGGFWRFDPNKLDQKQSDGEHFSTGHRHILSVAWNPVSKAFFIVMMGRDQLNTVDPDHYSEDDNAENPAEEMHLLKQGSNFGWPFTYYDPTKKARMLAPEFGGDNQRRAEAGKYLDPLVAFPAHWAPLQMAFNTSSQFPEKYRGGAFVAFHGSWNRAPKPQKGYNVAFVPFGANGMPSGGYEVFADGFSGLDEFTRVRDARYRPCGLAFGPDGSLYVSDSERGRVWRIFYGSGSTKPAPKAAAATPAAPQPSPAAGLTKFVRASSDQGPTLYKQSCAVCHMVDGSGVPHMQPAIDGSPVVSGDTSTFVQLLLKGAAQTLPATRTHYNVQMPTFDSLTDEELASLATYVRERFGKKSDAITPAQVAAERKK
jgi:glucose/arabinose dehydrogenase/mono/diheme cytochrome c family protein